MSGFNPRTRMIDSLAEELDDICTRMKRSAVNPDSSLSRNRIYLDFDNNNKNAKSGSKNFVGNSDLSAIENISDYLKTPMSPSKTVSDFENQHIGKKVRNRIYFDTTDGRAKNIFSDCGLISMGKNLETAGGHEFLSSSGRIGEKSFITADDRESSGFSSNCTSTDMTQNPSHRGMHRFMPRHKDEISIEIGDPIFVEYEAEDHWCYGTNLRSGLAGIFPAAHVFETNFDSMENILNAGLPYYEKDTFYVTYLASVEVAYHKGNDVLVQAIHKVLQAYQKKDDIVRPAPVLLDISFKGIHLIHKTKNNWFSCPNFDYFYGLQNISFCGAHPKQLKYFGFITKHPLLPRFACHVFMSNSTTEPVVDAIGRAFQQSYNEYMAFAHPTEDIYME